MDSIENYNRKIMEKHKELSILGFFPPIVNDDKSYFDDFNKAERALVSEVEKAAESGDYGSVVYKTPFEEFEAEYKDVIEEARLYLKRYGNTPEGIEKAIAAYKNEN